MEKAMPKVKTQSEENSSGKPIYCKCRLRFRGPAQYGRAIHKIKGATYDLELQSFTEVDLAHLEALKKAEPNLEVLKDGIN